MSGSRLATTISKKRKVNALTSDKLKRRKIKSENQTLANLPWKTTSRPILTGINGDEGILELEEVEGVEVVYEDVSGGRTVKFNVLEPESQSRSQVAQTKIDESTTDIHSEGEIEEGPFPFDSGLLPEWKPFSLHPHLQAALHRHGFNSPTSIQAAALKPALDGKDVIGVAQTGSGKTLAYGLPILQHLLLQPRPKSNVKRPLRALILAPTRELALQVSVHLNSCLPPPALVQPKGAGKTTQPKKLSPHVSCATIVGGMSSQKQRRVLDRGVDILVATPGRLWDMIEEDDELAKRIKCLRYLVLDEADRMIEAGHFAELENILRLTLREKKDDQIPEGPESLQIGNEQTDLENKIPEYELVQDGLQTFVFSATLSKDLQRNLKHRSRPKPLKRRKKVEAPATTLDDLVLRLDFRDPEPEIIDLSPAGGVVSTLQESKVECLTSDKDAYLYYFLLRYPGRSLVFLSSIDGIRRLLPLLELLEIKAYPLHSQLEQRQRLKNLDRFKSTPNAVLLATDIAARGLDVPDIDHVIHYQIPRTADAYIHRNGRTARAMREGFSMLMCAPDEKRIARALLLSINRRESEIPDMPIDLPMLDKLKARIQLARQIDIAQHKIKKANHEKNWLKEAADAMEIELDSDMYNETDGDQPSKSKQRTIAAKNTSLKWELKKLLARPLIAKGVSPKYITSGSRDIADGLLAGELHKSMVGLRKSGAGVDVSKKKQKRKVRPFRSHT